MGRVRKGRARMGSRRRSARARRGLGDKQGNGTERRGKERRGRVWKGMEGIGFMLAITTREHYHSGRLSATVQERRVYMRFVDIDEDARPGGMTVGEWRHRCVAQRFVDLFMDIGNGYRIIGGWRNSFEMVWVFVEKETWKAEVL